MKPRAMNIAKRASANSAEEARKVMGSDHCAALRTAVRGLVPLTKGGLYRDLHEMQPILDYWVSDYMHGGLGHVAIRSVEVGGQPCPAFRAARRGDNNWCEYCVRESEIQYVAEYLSRVVTAPVRVVPIRIPRSIRARQAVAPMTAGAPVYIPAVRPPTSTSNRNALERLVATMNQMTTLYARIVAEYE